MRKLLPVVFLFLIMVTVGQAEIPKTMSYQGVLTGGDGNPIADGTVSITFKLYNVTENGEALWEETQDVQVANGIFNVILGSMTALDLPFDEPYWLGITVGDDAELAPRTALTSSPYSLNAKSSLAELEPGQGLTIRNTDGEVTHELSAEGETQHRGTVQVNVLQGATGIKVTNSEAEDFTNYLESLDLDDTMLMLASPETTTTELTIVSGVGEIEEPALNLRTSALGLDGTEDGGYGRSNLIRAIQARKSGGGLSLSMKNPESRATGVSVRSKALGTLLRLSQKNENIADLDYVQKISTTGPGLKIVSRPYLTLPESLLKPLFMLAANAYAGAALAVLTGDPNAESIANVAFPEQGSFFYNYAIASYALTVMNLHTFSALPAAFFQTYGVGSAAHFKSEGIAGTTIHQNTGEGPAADFIGGIKITDGVIEFPDGTKQSSAAGAGSSAGWTSDGETTTTNNDVVIEGVLDVREGSIHYGEEVFLGGIYIGEDLEEPTTLTGISDRPRLSPPDPAMAYLASGFLDSPALAIYGIVGSVLQAGQLFYPNGNAQIKGDLFVDGQLNVFSESFHQALETYAVGTLITGFHSKGEYGYGSRIEIAPHDNPFSPNKEAAAQQGQFGMAIFDPNSGSLTTGLQSEVRGSGSAIVGVKAPGTSNTPNRYMVASQEVTNNGNSHVALQAPSANFGIEKTAQTTNPAVWGVSFLDNVTAVLGQNNSTNSTFPAVWGYTVGSGAAVYAQTTGSGNGLQVSHQGSSGNLAVFQANGNNQARIDRTGKGFFNGGTQAGGADVAEAFEVEGHVQQYEPGDVMVISTDFDRTMVKSKQSYSTLVAGVYASKPGVLLTERNVEDPHDDTVPLGVVGVIPTKVSGENGAIKRGDLLVTANIPGHAMKGTDRDKLIGAVLGKALENFDGKGTGMIKVLVNTK